MPNSNPPFVNSLLIFLPSVFLLIKVSLRHVVVHFITCNGAGSALCVITIGHNAHAA